MRRGRRGGASVEVEDTLAVFQVAVTQRVRLVVLFKVFPEAPLCLHVVKDKPARWLSDYSHLIAGGSV